MKKKIIGIAALALILGVVTTNKIKEENHLVVRDVLLENHDKIGNRVRKNVENEVAENKVSEVKAQVSEVYKDAADANRIDIRFVAGVDSYTYTNAKFNITIKNGEEVYKNVEKQVKDVYAAIEVKGEVLTAAEAFGEDYNYLISYTIKNVPESAWTYNFEATASVSADSGESYTTTDVVVKNIQEIQIADAEGMYLWGDVFEGGWDYSTKVLLVDENTYSITANFGLGSFIVCELDEISSNGSKLKAPNNKNFQILEEGNYTFTITRNDMSEDNTWTKAYEANANIELAQAYFKFTRNFDAQINTLYMCGFNGDWNAYQPMTKVSDTLFESTVNFGTNGGGFVAQQRRDLIDVLLKYTNNGDVKAPASGKYKVSVSLVYVDDTWTELVDVRGNYNGPAFVKFEEVVSSYVNLTQNGKAVATASTINGTNTEAKAINNNTSDRWESKQGIDGQWIMVDLGEVYTIDSIEIKWHGNAQAKDYRIEYATELPVEESDWIVAKSVVDAEKIKDRLDTNSFSDSQFQARYIRIYGVARNNTWGYSINELYIYGI